MKNTGRTARGLAGSVLVLALLLGVRPALGYIRASYSLGRIMTESTYIAVLRVSEVDRTKNVITYRKVRDIKGALADTVLVHNIGNYGEFNTEGSMGADAKGFRDWRDIMDCAAPGKDVVMFSNPAGQSEICMGNYWYQAWREGGGFRMVHSEPTFALAFAGRVPDLIAAVEVVLSGREAVVPCMVPSDVGALLKRTARIQGMKVSLKIGDYNPQRDAAQWVEVGELRRLAGLPGFTHYVPLPSMGSVAVGLAPADFTGDGKMDMCLYSESRVVLLENRDGFLIEHVPAVDGGARAAAWADYNGDGRPDLLLATPAGVRLLENQREKFVDRSAGLPVSPYPYVTAAAWIRGGTAGARPDILLADGFRGLRLYRNKTASKTASVAAGKSTWYYAGPFDNTGGSGFATAYPPEKGVELAAQYTGKGGAKVAWKEGRFTDGEVNSLAILPPEGNENSVVYLYRELECGAGGDLPVSLGSDDTLTVWLNGQQVHAENTSRGCAPDQVLLTLKTRPGRNTLLLKVCQGTGEFAFYFSAKLPAAADGVDFQDVSDAVGLGAGGVAGRLKGDHLAVADVNGDGYGDVLFSAGSGVLLLQSAQGFAEAPESGIAYRTGGVAPAFGDINGDGRPDLFVPQANGPSRLFLNDGKGHFRDVTERSGDLAKPMGSATCAVWSDFCSRGKADLLVGCVYGPNRYFRNRGDGTFADAGDEIGLYQNIYNTRGLCVMDVNEDDVPDLVMGNTGGESAVLLGNQERMTVAAAAPLKEEGRKNGDTKKGAATNAPSKKP